MLLGVDSPRCGRDTPVSSTWIKSPCTTSLQFLCFFGIHPNVGPHGMPVLALPAHFWFSAPHQVYLYTWLVFSIGKCSKLHSLHACKWLFILNIFLTWGNCGCSMVAVFPVYAGIISKNLFCGSVISVRAWAVALCSALEVEVFSRDLMKIWTQLKIYLQWFTSVSGSTHVQ